MLGIPLFMILFGADQAYRVGILDVTQAIVAFPVIAILGAPAGTAASAKAVLKEMFRSPLILMSLTGLVMNLSGVWGWMQSIGIDGIITDTFSYLSQPVSMLMLFCVGFNFTLNADNKKEIIGHLIGADENITISAEGEEITLSPKEIAKIKLFELE